MPRAALGNPVIDLSRDSFDGGDPYGSAMAWAGACADVLWDADPNAVPPSLGYSPGMGGPEVPSATYGDTGDYLDQNDIPAETLWVFAWLHGLDYDHEMPGYHLPRAADGTPAPDDLPYWDGEGFRERAEHLRAACVIWSRYLDWCKRDGRSY